MSELFVKGMQEKAAQKWLDVKGGKDGIHWFDLLGIAEGDVAPDTVQEAANTRLARLQGVEQQARSSGREDYVSLAGQLAAAVRAAAEALGDPAQRSAYREALLDARRRLFERIVAPAVVPGRRLDPPEMTAFVETAQEHRLDASEAKRIVGRLSGVGAAEGRYASFGVLYVTDDPAQENHFDLLGLDESSGNERLIRSQMEGQLKRAKEAEQKFPDQDRKRAAREFAAKVEEAGRVLLAPATRAGYLQQVRGLRQAKFREEVQLLYRPGQPVSAETVIRLMSLGRRLRLSETDTRQVITEVTGFADYMSLLGERKTPLLGHVDSLKLDIRSPADLQATTAKISIRNEGAGTLEGVLRSTSDWVEVTPQEFATQTAQEVTVTIAASRMPKGVPTAIQLMVESNGGSQVVTIEAQVGAGDRPVDTTERIISGLIYLSTSTLVIPFVCVFVFQKKSRFLAFQAAQATVLGVFLFGFAIGAAVLGEMCCLQSVLEVPMMIVSFGSIATAFVSAILCFLGKGVRLPIVADYAERFV
jgi:uncharacterized membrane protein